MKKNWCVVGCVWLVLLVVSVSSQSQYDGKIFLLLNFLFSLFISCFPRFVGMVHSNQWCGMVQKQQMGNLFFSFFSSSFSFLQFGIVFFLPPFLFPHQPSFIFFKLDSVDGQCGPPEWQNLNCDMSRSFVEELDMVFCCSLQFLCFFKLIFPFSLDFQFSDRLHPNRNCISFIISNIVGLFVLFIPSYIPFLYLLSSLTAIWDEMVV